MRTGERSAGTIVDFGDARQASKRDIDVEFQSTDGRSIIPVTIHAGRLRALAMGGFPPLAGPYKSMLAVSRGAHAVSGQEPDPAWAPVDDAEPGDWDSAAVPRDLPRLAFTGADDQIDYSLQWGGVQVRIGEPLARHRAELIAAGWDVQVLPGLDHLGAMNSSVVLPILTGWLRKVGWVKQPAG